MVRGHHGSAFHMILAHDFLTVLRYFFQWDNEAEGNVLKAWDEVMKARVKGAISDERDKAPEKARKAGFDVDANLSVIIPYCPTWIKEEHWM